MSKIVVAGGTGFVGEAIADLGEKLGHEIVVLSRQGLAPRGARGVKWDGQAVGPWAAELEGADAAINLCGHPISVKWNKVNRHEILYSRVRSTQVIGEAIGQCLNPPKVWLNSGAVGYYGDRGQEELYELSAPGRRGSFLTDVSVAWEQTLRECKTPKTRQTIVRVGFVLGRNRGALPKLADLCRKFLGGHHGSGAQFISWIHVDDVARAFLFCIDHEVPPVVNAVAPNACTNRFFMASLRAMLARPWCPGIPGFALRIASWFGAPDPSLLLDGQRVAPKALLAAGFRFSYDELRDAFANVLR